MIIGKQKKIQKSKKSPTQTLAESRAKAALLLIKAIEILEFQDIKEEFLSDLLGLPRNSEKTQH
jgi:hypothetical protein